MARLYADEDFNLRTVEHLRLLGHDVLTVDDAGMKGFGDPVVLAIAVADRRAVVTCNRKHFRRLHLHCRPHFGIIACTRDDEDPQGLVQRIHDTIIAMPTLDNELIRIYRPNTP